MGKRTQIAAPILIRPEHEDEGNNTNNTHKKRRLTDSATNTLATTLLSIKSSNFYPADSVSSSDTCRAVLPPALPVIHPMPCTIRSLSVTDDEDDSSFTKPVALKKKESSKSTSFSMMRPLKRPPTLPQPSKMGVFLDAIPAGRPLPPPPGLSPFFMSHKIQPLVMKL